MLNLLAGSLLISVLHAFLPNHWLPVLAISKKENWDLQQTTRVTFIAGLAHASSTALLGLFLGFIGAELSFMIEHFTTYVAPAILIAIGLFYIYQHSRHHHFHLHGHPERRSHNKIVVALATSMFFSPCFEIEGYFLIAGTMGWGLVVVMALLYLVVTVTGMVVWIRLAQKGLTHLNWHSLEHNAGIITGVTLVVSGVLGYFLH